MKEQNNKYIPAAIILAGFVIAGAIYLSEKQNNPTPVNTETQNIGIAIKPVSVDDHILGNTDAPIVMVEFSDTECPFCKNFQNTMNSLINTYGKGGQIAWVYRHFPLDSLHKKSRTESQATECAYKLGGNIAFWKYLDNVYSTTTSNDSLDFAKLPMIAELAGVDTVKFNDCLAKGNDAEKIEANLQDGVKAGAQGTPYTVMILKDKLSTSKKNSLASYIATSGLSDNVIISGTDKEVVLNGALPISYITAILDLILK